MQHKQGLQEFARTIVKRLRSSSCSTQTRLHAAGLIERAYLLGDGEGQINTAGHGQKSTAPPSPPQREGEGQANRAASSGQTTLAPPSQPLRGAGATAGVPDGPKLPAPAAAKPRFKPGHTKRGAAVIALKNKTILDTYMLEGKAVGNVRLGELPAHFTGNYEKAVVARLIYDRNHNRQQSLTVREVENAESLKALIEASRKEAIRAFRREGDVLAAG